MKKLSKNFSLPISLRVTLKLSLRSRFSAKKHFFVFCRKFGFNLEKLPNHCSQLKKQVKVDTETRSYDFLTTTREKNPMSRNIRDLAVTLQNAMNQSHFSLAQNRLKITKIEGKHFGPKHLFDRKILQFFFLVFKKNIFL